MNGITYYRLKSDYTGDYTKNCALNGTEVDNNFYVLEGRDVKSIAVKDKDIVITLMNGDHLSAEGALDFVKPEDVKTSVVKVEFDALNGVLKLTSADGTIQHIEGFSTNENTDFSVSTDNTLWGDGLRSKPLGVAPSARTGQFKTVKSIINVADGGSLPSCGNLFGDRYVTCEDISDYGYLYDYRAVREIALELQKSGWRIPTKADWDDLLNAVEPCECDKNHEKADKNKFLGKWAGKLLKSKTMWKNGCCADSCGCCGCDDCEDNHSVCGCEKPKKNCGCEGDCDCGDNTCFDYSDDPCTRTYESEDDCKCEKKCDDHKGLDAFGFRVTPAGYADDGCNFGYFKERGAFWTATTNEDNTKAYIKRFQFNKDGVYQDVIASNYHLSLRLVKDYNGKNYFDVEEIMDMEYPTLLLPSVAHGKSIWMSANLACGNASLNPMMPNNGQGLTYTRHYFINEWNGFKWVRNEMKQGDTVTVAKAPKGKKMVEYRVVGNDFVSVNEMIYSDVLDDVKPLIDAETEARKDADDKLAEAINNEAETRRLADEELRRDLNEEIAAREDGDNKLKEEIEHEASVREVHDQMLQQNIDDEATTREEADNALREDLNKEIAIREEADKVLQDNIDAEEQKRKDADDAEAEARDAADALLKDKIDEEATLREMGDELLQTNIDQEAEERKSADDEEKAAREDADKVLQENIDAETESRVKAVLAEEKAREDADKVLQDNIDAEATVRKMNDEMLQSNIDSETAERKTADEAEAKAREDADKVLQGNIDAEVKSREDADKEIEGKLLVQEGTEFDGNTGILTLKSAEGTNDVQVQFTFNFGEF